MNNKMKKINIFIALIFLAAIAFAIAQSDIESQINEFFSMDKVKFVLTSSAVSNIEKQDTKLILHFNKSTIVLEQNLDEKYVDVLPESCSKFGFVFLPGFGYDFIKETNKFTNNKGWALGIAYSQNDNYLASLSEMTEFVNKADSSGLIPIVRILGENWNENKTSTDSVVNFIRILKQNTNGKINYIQIWDKPNVIFDDNEVFNNPEEYADYVIEIKNTLNDPEIKIISASLSLGKSGSIGENRRRDSNYYLSGLLPISEFWESIDYWGSTAFDSNLTGNDYCFNASQIENYKGDQLCLDSIYGYKWELEKIRQETGKEYEVFLTETGYPTENINYVKTRELMQTLKEDYNVKSAIIFLGNGWDTWQTSSWLDMSNRTLNGFALRISDSVCR